jgi:hypothetical protein
MFALRRNIPSTLSRNFSTTARNNTFAKLTIVGRLADKPEITATSQGGEIMKYAIGTSTGRGENQKTSWFRIVSFQPEGPRRDFIANLDKGYVCVSVFFECMGMGLGKVMNSMKTAANSLRLFRTMVYVEAEARMETYTDAEGKNRTSLSAIQRMSLISTFQTDSSSKHISRN